VASLSVSPSKVLGALLISYLVKLYLAGLGGKYPLTFWVAFLALIGLTDLTNALQTWFLGYWASQYEGRDSYEVDVRL
jgi:hypothetical protein